jgi:uroporphyrinogen-III synthase
MRVLVTRPQYDAATLEAALEKRGHRAVLEPLMHVSFADSEPVVLEGVQALIATSRNGLRALRDKPAIVTARQLPLFAVGKATAAEARTLGFETVVTGAGTAGELVAHIVSVLDPAEGLLLHLAGDTLAADLKGALESHGFRVVQPVVYRMVAATSLSEETVERLGFGEIDGVILLSPRTAGIYAGLVMKQGLASAARALVHFCLSPAVAQRLAPLGSVRVEIAENPRLEEVLALIDKAATQSGG